MARKKKEPAEKENALVELKKYLPANKALALSFAVALVFASVGETTTTLAVDPKNNAKQNMVLEKEKEKEAQQAERDWEQDEEQGYSSYNPGYGYYHRPFMFTGSSSSNSKRATWGSSTATKKSSVGGYSISKGGATG